MIDGRGDAEVTVRTACDARDFHTAATLALEAYGQEILSFLHARLRSPADAEEAFAMFAEDLWKGLPQFAFRCSTRGWLYTVARNAANRYATAPARRAERNHALDPSGTMAAFVDRARSTTAGFRRTDVKDRVRALRDHLSPQDQTLLLLHIDRNLPWREIAMVMKENGEALDNETLDRESARLRKRFERVKAELKALATEQGLLKPRD